MAETKIAAMVSQGRKILVQKMKVPAEGKIEFWPGQVPEQARQVLARESSPCHISIQLQKPVQLNGLEFSFIVLPIQLTPDNQFQQVGQDVVLCQTQAEADESRELLAAAAKEHMLIIQAGNLGGIAFASRLRVFNTKFVAKQVTKPGGKKVWMTFELERDQATWKITVKRKQKARNQAEAEQNAQRWQAEFDAEKKKYFDTVAKSNVPPKPPERCESLSKTDRGDIVKAEMAVLRRQWKHCFALLDQRKAGRHFSEDDCRKTYLLDLAEQGESPLLSTKRPAASDNDFWQALVKASNRAVRGKRKLLLQLVDYLIAFNWKLGWCFLPEKELAERISSITKQTFTPGQIGKRRERLGLVPKHLPGPPFKSST